MKQSLSAFVISSLLSVSLFASAAAPALAEGKGDGHGRGKSVSASAKVRVQSALDMRKHMEDGDGDEDSASSTEKNKKEDKSHGGVGVTLVSSSSTTTSQGILWRIEFLLTNGAGKSGKIPPGLLHAPGIWKKLLGIFHVGLSTPDIIAPTVTAMNATGISTTGATINWATNERSRGTVYVGTTSPVAVASSTMHVDDSALAFTHHDLVAGLSASTTYFVKIVATDASGNATTSSEFSFTTNAIPDTTAPVISAVSVGNIASTSAQVTWTTNEAATGKVYYSTTTPVVVGGAQTTLLSTTSLSTLHDFALTGLTASTTYHFFVGSADASNNSASSGEGSFTTGI